MAPVINATVMLLTIAGAGLVFALLLNVVVAPVLFGYRALAGTGWTTRRTGWASWGIAFLLGMVVYTTRLAL
jgi:hypothetical protein